MLYRETDHQPVWATNTFLVDGYLEMQADGNLVQHDLTGVPMWASDTPDHPGGTLEVQVDGNLVLSDAGGPYWASGTAEPPLIVPPTGFTGTDVITYYSLDAVGSVRLITDAQGSQVSRFDYLPFGIEQTGSTPTDRRSFAGQQRDRESGFDYFGARYFNSQTGRFTTVEPGHVNGDVTDPQSWNAYAYARNNPLKYADPTGMAYEICVEGYSCQSVSDQRFAYLQGDPGAGIQLFGGYIYAGGKGVGTYRRTSVDPTFADLARLTGALSSRWLGEQSRDVAIGAAITATGGVAGAALGLGLAATGTLGLEARAMTEIADVTAKGAQAANLAVNLSARELQANLVKSGYNVVRQGVSSNGAYTILGNGQKTYTIYTASSTGTAAAEVRVAGQLVSKIRLSAFLN